MSAGDDTRTNGNGELYMKLGLHLTILVAGSLVFFAVTSGCSSNSDGGGSDAASAEVVAYELTQQFELAMTMSSTKFNDTRRIPRKYSCTQEDVSVPISWDGIPEWTVSLALLVESNQFPGPMWVHWLLWNIPPSVMELPEAVPVHVRERQQEAGPPDLAENLVDDMWSVQVPIASSILEHSARCLMFLG